MILEQVSSGSSNIVGRDILVDGYNIIKRNASFQSLGARNLAAARELLIAQLDNRYRHTPHQVIVVFDGDRANEYITHQRRIRIIYSRSGETADSVIARLVATAQAAGREVEMYSDDAEVQQSVARHGGDVRSSRQLGQELNAAPYALARLSRHRQEVRRQYGLDPAQKYEDEHEPHRLHRHKKGKPPGHGR
jgi:predicted RNA-binding protein with PIN domain